MVICIEKQYLLAHIWTCAVLGPDKDIGINALAWFDDKLYVRYFYKRLWINILHDVEVA